LPSAGTGTVVDVEHEPHPAPQERSPRRATAGRAGLVALVILLGVGKGLALRDLLNHPASLLVVVGVIGVAALLRGRLVLTACAGAVIVPVVVSPSSVLTGIAIGFGTLVTLMVLFVAVGTVLRMADAPA
jgi:hypothetical protein